MLHSHTWEKQAGRSKKRQLCFIACPLVHTAVNVNLAFQITSSLLLTQSRLKLTAMRRKYQSSNQSNMFTVSHWENAELLGFPLKALGSYNSQFIHLPLEETTLKVTTVCSLCLPWTLQNSANWATDLQCFNDLFSWPKDNFSALASMAVWVLKVSNERHSSVTRTYYSYHDGDHSSDTCYLVTYLDSTRMASAFFLVVKVLVAHCTPRSIFACLSSERILQSFLLNPPQNHFHTLKGCIALFT